MEKYSERNEECWYKEVCLADVSECNNCIKFLEMQYLMENSNLPKVRQRPQMLTAPECDVDAYTRLAEIKSDIVNFVEQGKSLYITSSNTGNGKTSWAIKLLLKYFDEIWAGNGLNVRGVFVSVPLFLLKSKDFKTTDKEFEKLKKYMYEVDLVVWDDIASTNLSKYDYSQLLACIDTRILEGKANIFTGNFDTKEELEECMGQKLASRVYSSSTEIIIFKGGDMR